VGKDVRNRRVVALPLHPKLTKATFWCPRALICEASVAERDGSRDDK
jgi:hypothetical protein